MTGIDVAARRWRGIIGEHLLEAFHAKSASDIPESTRAVCKLIADVAETSYRAGYRASSDDHDDEKAFGS